jgi:tRNA nucleotidyltransferase/poly(A) polymerase
MWQIIPDSIKELHSLFKQNQKDLFLVGGSVRDFIMGQPAKDFDLATSATPKEVLNILKGYKTKLQGEAFNVVVVFTEDAPSGMEIATFREDIYGEKLGKTRNPDVKLSTIDKDVLRRDLTYNALFFDLEKQEIIDLVGGIDDIKNGISRFVGDPSIRIMEDPLRILRILRFSNRYEFRIEDQSHFAISKNSDRLCIITKERIWTEITNAFKQAKDFHPYFIDFVGYGLLERYLDGFDLTNAHYTDVVKCSSLELYFATILKKLDIPNLAERLKEPYRMTHDFARKVEFFCKLYSKGIDPEQIEKWYKDSRDISHDMIQEWYDICSINTPINKAFLNYKPVANATELMSQGFSKEKLGKKIKEIEIQHFKTLIK